MIELWDAIKKLKMNSLIRLFLILGFLSSINFASYINQFDKRVFLLLDLNSISQHIMHFILGYSFSLAIVHFVIHILSSIFEYLDEFKILLSFRKKYSFMVKNLIASCLFLLHYVGFDYTLAMLVSFPIMYFFYFIGEFTIAQIKQRKLYVFNISALISILIIMSFFLGKYRADYIKKTSLVYVNSNTEIKESLFITTAAAVGLYNIKSKSISFVPWDNVKKLEFINE